MWPSFRLCGEGRPPGNKIRTILGNKIRTILGNKIRTALGNKIRTIREGGPYFMKKPHFGDVMKLRVNKF